MTEVTKNTVNAAVDLAAGAIADATDAAASAVTLAQTAAVAPIKVGAKTLAALLEEFKAVQAAFIVALKDAAEVVTQRLP